MSTLFNPICCSRVLVTLFGLFFASNALAQSCPSPFRSASIATFGVPVCALERVSDRALDHAATVMETLLDYDRDGKPDNPRVLETLVSSGSFYAVFRNEREIDRFFDGLDDHEHDRYETAITVMEDEMDITGRDGWDPTVEEALHLITQFGYAALYPSVFGEMKGSEIADLMDQARGGYFRRVPNRYPKGAYFTYDDRSCDYRCQVTEFTFWAITSLRGLHNNRRRDIEDEWKLNTAEKMRSKAPELVALLERPEFNILF